MRVPAGRRLAGVSLLGGVGALLVACGAEPPQTPPKPTEPPKPAAAAPTSPPAAPPTPAPTTAAAGAPTTAPAAAPTNAPAAAPTAAPAATSAPAAAPPKPAARTGTITILVGAEYGVVTPDTMTPIARSVRGLFDKYQQSVQPGVKIQLEDLTLPQGQIYYEALRLRALAGNIPDLVVFEPRPSTMNADLFYQFPRELLD